MLTQRRDKGTKLTHDEMDDNFKMILDKQDKLISGSNIKTINGESIIGPGNIEISSVAEPIGRKFAIAIETSTNPNDYFDEFQMFEFTATSETTIVYDITMYDGSDGSDGIAYKYTFSGQFVIPSEFINSLTVDGYATRTGENASNGRGVDAGVISSFSVFNIHFCIEKLTDTTYRLSLAKEPHITYTKAFMTYEVLTTNTGITEFGRYYNNIDIV